MAPKVIDFFSIRISSTDGLKILSEVDDTVR